MRCIHAHVVGLLLLSATARTLPAARTVAASPAGAVPDAAALARGLALPPNDLTRIPIAEMFGTAPRTAAIVTSGFGGGSRSKKLPRLFPRGTAASRVLRGDSVSRASWTIARDKKRRGLERLSGIDGGANFLRLPPVGPER